MFRQVTPAITGASLMGLPESQERSCASQVAGLLAAFGDAHAERPRGAALVSEPRSSTSLEQAEVLLLAADEPMPAEPRAQGKTKTRLVPAPVRGRSSRRSSGGGQRNGSATGKSPTG